MVHLPMFQEISTAPFLHQYSYSWLCGPPYQSTCILQSGVAAEYLQSTYVGTPPWAAL